MTTKVYDRLQYIALYPNNEVRFGSRPIPQSKAKAETSQAIISPVDQGEYSEALQQWAKERAIVLGGDAIASQPGAEPPLVSNLKFQDNNRTESAQDKLDREIQDWKREYKQELEEKKLSHGYGLVKDTWPSFSSCAMRSISLRASAIANIFPKEQQVFLTGTLPGSTQLAITTFAAWSSWFMNRVQVWLKENYSVDFDLQHSPKPKSLRERKLWRGECYHVSVWEHQRRGALHYHGLVATPESDALIDSFKDFWISLLVQVSEKSGVNLFARKSGGAWARDYGDGHWVVCRPVIRVDAQKVQKSVAQYLSKYLTKENGQEKENRAKNPPPARWWASTRAARNLANAQTIFLPLPSADASQSLSFLDLATQLMGSIADFTCPLINPWSRQKVGQIGIFDDRFDAKAVFDMFSSHLQNLLASNKSDIELLDRMKHSAWWESIRRKQQIIDECDLPDVNLSGSALAQLFIHKLKLKDNLLKQWNKTLDPVIL